MEEAGQRDRAVQGIEDTVAALLRAQVDTLLLDPTRTADRTLWFDPAQPAVAATSREDLAGLGVEHPEQDRLDSVLIRSCWATDADLLTLSAVQLDLSAGVGAILRYSDASTGASRPRAPTGPQEPQTSCARSFRGTGPFATP